MRANITAILQSGLEKSVQTYLSKILIGFDTYVNAISDFPLVFQVSVTNQTWRRKNFKTKMYKQIDPIIQHVQLQNSDIY